jgi:hypothetical protein
MKCPHCATSVHESWSQTHLLLASEGTRWIVGIMQCPQCSEHILRFGRGSIKNTVWVPPTDWVQMYPRGSNRGPVPNDVPSNIAADYIEAANVLTNSAKASAALSRRCLQAVLREAGYNQNNLAQQIEAVLNETDTRKAVPSGVHIILDAIRNFGNFSAHPVTDQTTLQIIDVENDEAEFCLDILDAVFDHYYVRPADAKRKKAALDAKLKAAGKPPSK